MKFWFQEVKDDINKIVDFLDYYQKEYEQAVKEVRLLNTGNLEKSAAGLPHLTEQYFTQLQDIEAVLEHLNIQYRRIRSESFKKYFENIKSARALTAREAEKYVDMDPVVVSQAELINMVALQRNMHLSIMKGLDAKSYAVNNITKLKVAGIELSQV